MKKIVNALGEQCPIPVVKSLHALDEMTEPGILEVHVDNAIAVQNLTKMAGSRNLTAQMHKLNDKEYVVTINVTEVTNKQPLPPVAVAPLTGDGLVVAISSSFMGTGDDKLGKTLLKGFVFALSQLPQLPQTILLYNGGAKLSVEGSESLEDLQNMEKQGVKIMTCGTCLNYYGLADKLKVGEVTNMYAIVETLAGAGKVIKP
jgi:selenium metabolism protein YedF